MPKSLENVNEAAPKPMTPERMRPILVGRKADWVLMSILFVILIFYIAIVQGLSWRATVFPWAITIFMLVVLGVYAQSKWRNPAVWDEVYDPEHESMSVDGDTGPDYLMKNAKAVRQSLAGFLAIAALTMLLGPEYAIPLFVGGYLYLKGEGRIFAAISLVVLWLVMHFGFAQAMHIDLPDGYLIDWLT